MVNLRKIQLKHVGYALLIAVIILNFWFYRFDLHAYFFNTNAYYSQPAHPFLVEWPNEQYVLGYQIYWIELFMTLMLDAIAVALSLALIVHPANKK